MSAYIKSINIAHSFSKPYVPYDNSVIESSFASLNKEELCRKKYQSKSEFFLAIDDYMDFCNTNRAHKELQYKTSEQIEHECALTNGLFAD